MDDDKLTQIDRLFALKERGVLSDSEFQIEKDKILGRDASSNVSPEVSSQSHSEPEQLNSDRDDRASTIEWEDEPPRNASRFVVSAIAVLLVVAFGYWTYSTYFSQPDNADMSSTSGLASSTSNTQKGLTTLSGTPSNLADAKLPPKSQLLGKTYYEALQNKAYDPVIGITRREAFEGTLNGPQTPSILMRMDNKDVLVWEMCTAHMCSNRSIVAVENGGTGRFVATIIEGKVDVLKNAWFGRKILDACNENACDFTATDAPMGKQSSLEELTADDLSWAQGGASCRATNASGRTVLYTEGKAAIRFKGRVRNLTEDGIGRGPFSSDDGFDDSLLVEIAERSGPRTEDYEKVSYPAYLKVFDGAWASVPVTMTCES